MLRVYEDTVLTPIKVARLTGYVDWSSQPSKFKKYPNFLFRYKYNQVSAFKVIELSRIITSKLEIASKPYYQLNTPSAGNLHPVELYVQIRGVKGILSGIYHVDAQSEELVLIKEIEKAGLERYVGLSKKFEGIIYLVSCVPFRSQWKYGKRSLRYCYLDIGHQIGSINVSCKLFGQSTTILSDFDRYELNNFMGFKQDEFTSAVISSGNLTDKSVEKFKENLISVSPTDYSELQEDIVSTIYKADIYKGYLNKELKLTNEEDILLRRSARLFSEKIMPKEEIEHFMHILDKHNYPLECYNIVLNSSELALGIYFNGVIVKEGDFRSEVVSLLVDQHFIKNASIVSIITSKHFSENKLMSSGVFAHELSIEVEHKGFGFSGIGAFYDTKVQKFLNSNNYILYACAIGSIK